MPSNGFPAWAPSRQFHLGFQESLVLAIISEAWSCVCSLICAGSLLPAGTSQAPPSSSLPGLSCISGDFPIRMCSAALSNISHSPALSTCPGAPGQDNQTTSFPASSHVHPGPTNTTALLLIMPCSFRNLKQLSQLENCFSLLTLLSFGCSVTPTLIFDQRQHVLIFRLAPAKFSLPVVCQLAVSWNCAWITQVCLCTTTSTAERAFLQLPRVLAVPKRANSFSLTSRTSLKSYLEKTER